jgi:hypothetical protein
MSKPHMNREFEQLKVLQFGSVFDADKKQYVLNPNALND